MPKDAASAVPDSRPTDASADNPPLSAATASEPSQAAALASESTLPAVTAQPLGQGQAAWITLAAPAKTGPNEDAVAALPLYGSRGLLLVADGLGGHRGGRAASQLVRKRLTALARRLSDPPQISSVIVSGVVPIPTSFAPLPDADPRPLILDEMERVNQRLLRSRVGSATTLALVELRDRRVRSYHVGDSEILITSQRGRVKYSSISHSPIGYAVESGLLTNEDAMFHPDRHIVSNVVGSERMSIELGRWITLSPRDTVLLASDGLFDNLLQEEIVEIVRKGPLSEAVQTLAQLARQRMLAPLPGQPSKPDDLTILCYRSSV